VRGTPHHIAEKYMQLARDAQSSGDPVLAENYLQHAEHYNRIIMAYAEQFQGQAGEGGQQPFRYRQPGAPMEPGEGDDGAPGSEDQPMLDGGEQPQSPSAGGESAPQGERQPFQDRGDRNFNDRGDRQERFNRPDNRPDTQGGQPGGFRDRNADGQDRQFRRERDNRFNDRGDRPNRPFQSGEPRGERYNANPRGSFDNRDNRGSEPQGERRFDRDRGGDRDRGFRNERFDRGSERPDRTDAPQSPPAIAGGGQAPGQASGHQPQHERYVPNNRPQRTFQPPPVEQPPVEWVAGAERSPQVEPPVPRPVEAQTRPVVAPIDVVSVPLSKDDAPAPVVRSRRKAPAPAAAGVGASFQEHDQPSFLKKPTRRVKADPKPDAGPDASTEPKGD
jgi:hypothetical protein